MTKTLMQIWEKTKCYHSFNVLPVEVRQKLNIEESTFDSKKMKIELTTTGNKGIGEFWYEFCVICQKTVDGLIQTVDGLIKKYKDKLPTIAKIEHLMDNWGLLGISNEIIDVIGCYMVRRRRIYILD